VSAYHAFYREDHGRETRPTYYFQWKLQRPYHIDYCFIPATWAKHVRRVEIGEYEEWKKHSDHRPLLIEVTENAVQPLRRGDDRFEATKLTPVI
jgi:endonuclease/exonuclease/phosphatase family metal-dependent hydrolase